MPIFELDSADITALGDSDLRELVARLCEAELRQRGIPTSCLTWGGAQEAPDGGLDVSVRNATGGSVANFVPRAHTGYQVKKPSLSKAGCKKEMQEDGKLKAIIKELAQHNGAYIIVSGKDNCTVKMQTHRSAGMHEAVAGLPNKNKLHLDFFGCDRLRDWLRQHPGVSLWVRSRLGKPLAGWKPFGRWAATPLGQTDEFLADDHARVINANVVDRAPISVLQGIELVRGKLRKAGSAVRIAGLSGVGKTRFAQALFEYTVGQDALPASDVIYADLGASLNPSAAELLSYLIANHFAAYLVLDNCPPDVHRSLQKQMAEQRAALHLLTIEYDISDDIPEETDVIYLEPSSEKTVAKLLERRFPKLEHVNADRIAQFSGGNARLALALASQVDASETLSSFSDEELFQRLFAQRKGASDQLRQGAEILALAYSFSTSSARFNDELMQLATISGLSRLALYRHQAELLRRQLAQQRGNWRAILPHALANHLAKHAFENIPADDINAVLFEPKNIRLLQSCAHRLGFLHNVEAARELALSWMRPGAPLGNLANCTDEHLKVIENVAPAVPEAMLSAIEGACKHVGFASRDSHYFDRFVRLLCHLAYDDALFDRATAVLLQFAKTEKDGEKNNSIAQDLSRLFAPSLSGTEATPARRLAFVEKLLVSGSARHLQLAKQILDMAFQARGWFPFRQFQFGAHKRGAGWQPSTDAEYVAWHDAYLSLLRPGLNSSLQTVKDWTKDTVASHFHKLWSDVGLTDMLEEIVLEHGRNGTWPEIWVAIKKCLTKDAEENAPEHVSRLCELQRFTAPSDLYSEIEAYVLIKPWDHIHERGESRQIEFDKICGKATQLGESAASDTKWLDHFGSRFWSTDAQMVWTFGVGLAVGGKAKDELLEQLAASFEKHQSVATNVRLISGFLNRFDQLDSPSARENLGRALAMPALKPYAVQLLTAFPMSAWVADTLVELARERAVSASEFERLSYGWGPASPPEIVFENLLNEINQQDQGFLTTISLLSSKFYTTDKYAPSAGIRAVARAALLQLVSAHRKDLREAKLDEMNPLLEIAFDATAPAIEIKAIIERLCDGIETRRLYEFELTQLTRALIQKYPEWLLDSVFNTPQPESDVAYLLFGDDYLRRTPNLNETPVLRVLTWCGGNQGRIEKAATVVSHYAPINSKDAPAGSVNHLVMSDHLKALLEVTGHKSAMVQMIFHKISPGSWSGSLANVLDARSKALSELLDFPDVEVQTLVNSKLPLLEQTIRERRARETEQDNDREQRFE